MKFFANWPFLIKIMFIGAVSMFFISCILFALFIGNQKRNKVQAYVEKARMVCLTAESTLQEMEGKWASGVFSIEQVQQYAKDKDLDRLLATIPVITAWKAAMRKAELGGYEFRVPKVNPRNNANTPDHGLDYKIEGPALALIKANQLDEYHVIDENINAIRYFRPVRLTESCMICHGDPAQSQTLWGNNTGTDPTGTVMENWQVGEIHGAFEIIQTLDQADRELASDLITGGGAIVLCFAIGCVFFFFVSRSITKPIQASSDFVGILSKGNFSGHLEMSQKDEIGTLASGINQMIDSLTVLFKDVVNGMTSLGVSSRELSAIADDMAGAAASTTEKSRTVAQDAESMGMKMTSIAAAMEEASTNLSMVASASEEMSVTLTQIDESTDRACTMTGSAVDQAQTALNRVHQLGEAANTINQVVDAINDISEQTNLLALNATIEAARAGESGKGFAVVAGEIKELSKQTALATEDIRTKISGMQSMTTETVSDIKHISEVINNINDIVSDIAKSTEEQTLATKEISQNVVEASAGVSEVNVNVSESTVIFDEIFKKVKEVTEDALDVENNSLRIDTNSQEQVNLANRLNNTLAKLNFGEAKFDIGKVKEAHLAWRNKLEDMLRGKQELSLDQVLSHHHCEFGKWYDQAAKTEMGDSELFKEVGIQHERVHAFAKKTVETYHAGNIDDAKRTMRGFEEIRISLFEALDKFYVS